MPVIIQVVRGPIGPHSHNFLPVLELVSGSRDDSSQQDPQGRRQKLLINLDKLWTLF